MKNIRKFISVLLALVFVLSLLPTYTFADSADKSSKVEKLTAQQFPAIDKPVTIDSKNPLAAQLEGLFETPLKVEGDSDRKIAQYFPRNLSYRQPEVALHVPSGKDYETFFQTSGWKDVADDNGIVVALMIPGANGWKDDETAYSEAAYKFMDARTYYQAQDSAFYLVGYEKGAKVAMSVAAMHADRYAGVAGFGLDDMDVSVLKKAAEAESGAKGVMQSEVAVPVWIGAEKRTDNVNALVEFWKNANECGDEATSGKYADEIYEFPKYLATTNELTYSHASKVMVTIGKDYNNKEFTKNLYGNFLKRVRRQDSGDINSLRSFATNRELGMDYATMDVNGTTREFYVYVPSSVKSGRLSNVPVVFAFHGGGGSGEEFANRTAFYKIAEERNFIVVFPTGSRSNNKFKASTTWTVNDLPFFKSMREYMLKNYSSIDSTRVYVIGQSMGGVMTEYITLNCPELIAAAVGASGFIDFKTEYNLPINEDVMLPVMYTVGLKDYGILPGGRSIIPLRNSTIYWCERYGIDETGTAGFYVDGNFNITEYATEKGVPMLRVQTVTDKIHSIIPDEEYMGYEFLSQFSRSSDNTLYYMGQVVNYVNKLNN